MPVYSGLEGGYESIKKLGGWESLDCDLRGHTTGHLLSAYGLMYAATGAEIFKQKGDSIVEGLAEVQNALGDSGYLSAYPEELINRNIRGKSVWAPWYTLHKLFSGLIDQYLYSDNEKALEIATRMGEWAYNKLKPLSEETRVLMLRNEFGGINEAFYNLYSITGDDRFCEVADIFYHNDVLDPLKRGECDFGTKHTNTFIPKVIGEARRYEITGNEPSWNIANLFWNEMIANHIFVTGSLSQKEHFFDPKRQSEYINGYTGETCCTYNMLKLSRHEFCLTGDPKVADYYERALFNHILAQQDPESGMVCYFLPLKSGCHKVYSTPENSFWCCVGSGFENHSKYGEGIYYHDDKGIYVNLFIPSELKWEEKGVKLTQITDFPESEKVMIRIDGAPDAKFSLFLRYPEWSGDPVVKINGKAVRYDKKPSSYIELDRKWRKGDMVSIEYPMSFRVESPRDNEEIGALLYGPIVLAGNLGTEGMDSPAPFSDPTKRNDYYTYDYRIPANLKTGLKIDIIESGEGIFKNGKGLKFRTKDGIDILPLYDANRMRYVVYWDLMK